MVKKRLIDRSVEQLVVLGKKKGYLTYDEMNDDLPDSAVSPSRLDNLLATLDEMGIKLLDEADVEKKSEDEFEESAGKLGDGKLRDDEMLEKQLAGAEFHHIHHIHIAVAILVQHAGQQTAATGCFDLSAFSS